MEKIVKALNTMNELVMTLQNNIHIDLVGIKEELKGANELKQKEIQEATTLADNFRVNDKKLEILKESLNTIISTVNQHSEVLKMIMECVEPFSDNIGNTIGNYDCCRDEKKEKKKEKKINDL